MASQDRAGIENNSALILEDKGVRSDTRLEKNGGDALQLLALGTGLWVMVGVVFFRFQVEIQREVTPPDNDKQDKQSNTADFE